MPGVLAYSSPDTYSTRLYSRRIYSSKVALQSDGREFLDPVPFTIAVTVCALRERRLRALRLEPRHSRTADEPLLKGASGNYSLERRALRCDAIQKIVP